MRYRMGQKVLAAARLVGLVLALSTTAGWVHAQEPATKKASEATDPTSAEARLGKGSSAEKSAKKGSASGSANRRFSVSAKEAGPPVDPAKRTFSITVTGEIDPHISPVVGNLVEHFYQAYPKLVAQYENPERPAPNHIFMTIKKDMKIPAFCSGSRVTVNADWLRSHPDDIGVLTHELTHAVQAYPPSEHGWLVEGIADYARSKFGPAKQPGWSLPARLSRQQNYKDGYTVTAKFLDWVEKRHPGTVDKIHRNLQANKFVIEDFERATGRNVQALWEACLSDLNKRQSEAKK